MKKIIATFMFIVSIFYTVIAIGESARQESGICNISIVREGAIFNLSLGEHSYRVTSNNPALECGNLAMQLGKNKQSDPKNTNSKLSISYTYSGSIELIP